MTGEPDLSDGASRCSLGPAFDSGVFGDLWELPGTGLGVILSGRDPLFAESNVAGAASPVTLRACSEIVTLAPALSLGAVDGILPVVGPVFDVASSMDSEETGRGGVIDFCDSIAEILVPITAPCGTEGSLRASFGGDGLRAGELGGFAS